MTTVVVPECLLLEDVVVSRIKEGSGVLFFNFSRWATERSTDKGAGKWDYREVIKGGKV
jgi:hypothetical protein